MMNREGGLFEGLGGWLAIFGCPLPPSPLESAQLLDCCRRGLKRMRGGFTFALAAVVGLSCVDYGLTAVVPANSLLGTCLDQDWVDAVEATRSISASARGADGSKLHPFLHAALPKPRFWVDDWRTEKDRGELYQSDCMEDGDVLYGVGSTADDPSGRVNGSLVIELPPFSSIGVSTMVFAILAQELLGYEVSYLSVAATAKTAERMSSIESGTCSPSHVILEVRANAAEAFNEVANETYSSASIGYYGRGGMYTTTKFVEYGQSLSPPFNADFWRDYRDSEALITSVPVSLLTSNPAFYPLKTPGCSDTELGCQDSCTWTKACADRMANSLECLLVIMVEAQFDPGYLAAVLANLDIPAKLCYLGGGQSGAFIATMVLTETPVVFYYYEPELLPLILDGKITRVGLPATLPRLSEQDTGTFGEDGAGTVTSNPVKVDFPFVQLDKYSASVLQASPPVKSLLNRISLSMLVIDDLMRRHVAYLYLPSPPVVPAFSAACDWLKEPGNYPIWSPWLSQLPDCSITQHVGYSISGCSDSEAFRTIAFEWKMPDPRSPSEPYDCNNAGFSLPSSIVTSRSCEWLESRFTTWIEWTTTKPRCSEDHYSYRVSECDSSDSMRTVEFYWLLADTANVSASSECARGDDLPDSVRFECEYVMYASKAFKSVAAMAIVLLTALVMCGVYVVYYRDVPIIKRSQYQFLLSMITGGILMTTTTLAYAGPPRTLTCVNRPTGMALSFTLIFGSLMVKSLRVYRVFMKSAMKRVVLSASTMFKILFVFLLVDSLLLTVWFTIDPMEATAVSKQITTASGAMTVDVQLCTSSSFIFSALLIFWKAMLLFAGLYLSFLIRKVSTDFQESTWIFSASIAVLFSSVVMLGLAYLVELKPTAFYLFFAFMLLSSTAIVMALMLVPKLLRHREDVSQLKATEMSTSGDSSSSNVKGMNGVVPEAKPASVRSTGGGRKRSNFVRRHLDKAAAPTAVQVTPVKPFADQSGASGASKRDQSKVEA